jgi:hypothetical protein
VSADLEAALGDVGESVVGALFGVLTAVRGSRVFHPQGAAFAASFEPDAAPAGAAWRSWDLVRSGRARRAVVRLSRGAGLPQPLVDHLGISVRIVDAYGRGRHQDLLLGASHRAPLGRHLLLPARGFLSAWYSSVLPYRLGGDLVVVGAGALSSDGDDDDPEQLALNGAMPIAFQLEAAQVFGAWQPFGRVTLRRRLADRTADALRFNPFNTGGGLEPAGVVNRVRNPAYRSSQDAR